MGLYGEQILPRIQDRVMDRRYMRELRSRVCSGLHGQVLEIGFGTGLNTSFYPSAVDNVYAVKPSAVCMRIAAPRIEQCTAAVHHAGLDGQKLDLPTGEFDVVVSTWTLCSIPNVSSALEEVRRVLRPGGSFHFVEHGRSPDGKVRAWQDRVEPLNKLLAGGCHLTREISSLIEHAGFALEHLDTYYLSGEPKIFGYSYEGRAVAPT